MYVVHIYAVYILVPPYRICFWHFDTSVTNRTKHKTYTSVGWVGAEEAPNLGRLADGIL